MFTKDEKILMIILPPLILWILYIAIWSIRENDMTGMIIWDVIGTIVVILVGIFILEPLIE